MQLPKAEGKGEKKIWQDSNKHNKEDIKWVADFSAEKPEAKIWWNGNFR